jgi:voltage-gated potassium channel
MKNSRNTGNMASWQKTLHDIIFEADTKAGKRFDIILMFLIGLSVSAVLIDSMPEAHQRYGILLLRLEWAFTIIFTIEYILRIYTTRKPLKYVFSFYGIIDFMAILPTYLSLVFAGTQFLLIIRILRLMRVFRVLKLARYVRASDVLRIALRNSKHKIIVFLEVVIIIVTIVGSLIYLIEGPESGFTSIPISIYWAVVTLTTVGYGDLAPVTFFGRFLASIVMIIGYAIIAVPTGILSVEMVKANSTNTRVCPSCNFDRHDDDSAYCKKCGEELKILPREKEK